MLQSKRSSPMMEHSPHHGGSVSSGCELPARFSYGTGSPPRWGSCSLWSEEPRTVALESQEPLTVMCRPHGLCLHAFSPGVSSSGDSTFSLCGTSFQSARGVSEVFHCKRLVTSGDRFCSQTSLVSVFNQILRETIRCHDHRINPLNYPYMHTGRWRNCLMIWQMLLSFSEQTDSLQGDLKDNIRSQESSMDPGELAKLRMKVHGCGPMSKCTWVNSGLTR